MSKEFDDLQAYLTKVSDRLLVETKRNAELRRVLERLAKYPRVREEEISVAGVREIARKALASQPTSHNTDREDEWPPWPRVGKRYLVWFSGVLQHETYEFDRGDDGMGGGEYFWNREDVDECPPFDPDNHRWLALDDIDAARAGEDV